MTTFDTGDRVVSYSTQAHGTVHTVWPLTQTPDGPKQGYDVLWDGAGAFSHVWEKFLEDEVPAVKTVAQMEAEESIRYAFRTTPAPLQDPGINPKDIIGATKPDLSLVPPAGSIHVATAMQNGADKYGAYNWRDKKVQAMTYLAAAKRHIDSYLDGEEVAEDSGVHHLAHAAACMFIVLDAIETGNLVDNRPTAGAAAALIKRLTKGGSA